MIRKSARQALSAKQAVLVNIAAVAAAIAASMVIMLFMGMNPLTVYVPVVIHEHGL